MQAAVIQFTLTPLGPHSYHYNYSLAAVPFLTNQELDIRFDPTIFGSISNATAGPGFFQFTLQPNNPPGAFGDYILLALQDVPAPTGTFGVDVFVPGNAAPGAQLFFINQLDADGNIIATLQAGTTTPGGSPSVPEPTTLSLSVVAALAAALYGGRHRFSRYERRDT